MDVRDAVASRYSCRAFLPHPVPEHVVRAILEQAARAPSGGNLQPWRVVALAGEPLEELKAMLRPRFATELPRGEGAEYQVYPSPLDAPYRSRRFSVGEALYRSIGVAREDRAARIRQYARNYLFFDAPAALFCSIERGMGPPQWSDLGGFVQTVMLLARAYGLHSCAQEAWTNWHKTVSRFIGLPAEELLFCAIAIGYADAHAPINGWRSPRESLAAFATFRGFSGPAPHS
ncbi:MAG: nitroreductase [Proteobacteria bacterium]|nr:nitroreductase [Pseudomonadota bacterium]